MEFNLLFMIFYTISSLVFWWYSRYMTQLIHEWQGLDTEQSEVLDMSIWVSASNSSTHLEIFEGLAGYERWSIKQIGQMRYLSTSIYNSLTWSTTFVHYDTTFKTNLISILQLYHKDKISFLFTTIVWIQR